MSHSTHAMKDSHQPVPSMVEPDHVDIKAIFGFGIGLAVVTIVAHVLMLWMFHAEVAGVDASNPAKVFPLAVSEDDRRPPAPRLQGGVEPDNPGVREDLKDLRAAEDAILNGYGWVDRNNNVVRIPVADAMKLTLQRGLPARQSATADAPAASASSATQDTQEKK